MARERETATTYTTVLCTYCFETIKWWAPDTIQSPIANSRASVRAVCMSLKRRRKATERERLGGWYYSSSDIYQNIYYCINNRSINVYPYFVYVFDRFAVPGESGKPYEINGRHKHKRIAPCFRDRLETHLKCSFTSSRHDARMQIGRSMWVINTVRQWKRTVEEVFCVRLLPIHDLCSSHMTHVPLNFTSFETDCRK